MNTKTHLLLCIAVMAMLILGPSKSHALDIATFPIFTARTDEANSEITVLWPIFERETHPGYSRTALRPLWHSVRDEDNNSRRWNAIWPLIWWEHRNIDTAQDFREFWFFPLVFWNSQQRGEGNDWDFTLFPLWWSGNDYRVFFPFYWDIENYVTAFFPFYGQINYGDGYDLSEDPVHHQGHTKFILWPLWSSTDAEGQVSQNILWPFFGWAHRGDDLSRVRAWPLYTHQIEDDGDYAASVLWPIIRWKTRMGELRRFQFWPLYSQRTDGDNVSGRFLWPLGSFKRGTLDNGGPDNEFKFFPIRHWREYGEEKVNSWWPLFTLRESPWQRTFSVAWPLYQRSEYPDQAYTQTDVLFSILGWTSGESRHAFHLFPLYGQGEQAHRSHRYVLFPLYGNWEHFNERHESSVNMLLPLWIANENRNLVQDTWSRSKWLFPLFFSEADSDGSSTTQWLFPFFYTSQDVHERSWGGLFGLYERGTRADGSSWTDLFGPFYNRDTDADGTIHRRYRGLIFQHDRHGGERRTAMLWGLVSRWSGEDGVDWRLFDFTGELREP